MVRIVLDDREFFINDIIWGKYELKTGPSNKRTNKKGKNY